MRPSRARGFNEFSAAAGRIDDHHVFRRQRIEQLPVIARRQIRPDQIELGDFVNVTAVADEKDEKLIVWFKRVFQFHEQLPHRFRGSFSLLAFRFFRQHENLLFGKPELAGQRLAQRCRPFAELFGVDLFATDAGDDDGEFIQVSGQLRGQFRFDLWSFRFNLRFGRNRRVLRARISGKQ